jgi:hypothetical protein
MAKRNKTVITNGQQSSNGNNRPSPPPPPAQRRRKTRDSDCCSVNFIKYSLHIFNVIFFVSILKISENIVIMIFFYLNVGQWFLKFLLVLTLIIIFQMALFNSVINSATNHIRGFCKTYYWYQIVKLEFIFLRENTFWMVLTLIIIFMVYMEGSAYYKVCPCNFFPILFLLKIQKSSKKL